MHQPTRKVRESHPLETFGLTAMESRVYGLLLARGPLSGYAVAKATRKSLGSVYKVLERLEGHGAVLAADTDGTRTYRATPIDEVLAMRQTSMRAAAEAVRASLASDSPCAEDGGLYALGSLEQALERARAMLESSTDFCIVTATPRVLGALDGALRATATRAVHVGVKAFAPAEIPGVRVALDPRGIDAVSNGPGEWLTITADAREALGALFDHRLEHLRSGWWTRHTHLNWTSFTGLGSDFVLAAVRTALSGGASAAQVSDLIASFAPFQTPRSSSKRELMVAARKARTE